MLKKILKSRGITVDHFGVMIGESKSTAHRMSTGQYFSRMKKACQKIYNATGLTPNEIFEIPKKEITECEVTGVTPNELMNIPEKKNK